MKTNTVRIVQHFTLKKSKRECNIVVYKWNCHSLIEYFLLKQLHPSSKLSRSLWQNESNKSCYTCCWTLEPLVLLADSSVNRSGVFSNSIHTSSKSSDDDNNGTFVLFDCLNFVWTSLNNLPMEHKCINVIKARRIMFS